MHLELKEFAKAARSMHQQPGGIKRTRLMLRLRPYKTRKIFVLKATDGRTTLTTRVEHQGQVKLVEALMSDFVGECTRLSVPPPPMPPASATAAAGGGSATQVQAAHASPAAASSKDGAGAASKASQGGSGSGQAAAPQVQQQQQKASKPSNKGKKGKKH